MEWIGPSRGGRESLISLGREPAQDDQAGRASTGSPFEPVRRRGPVRDQVNRR